MSKSDDAFTTTIPESRLMLHKGDVVGPKFREMGDNIHLGKKTEVTLTREFASELLKLDEFIAERSIKTPHVVYLQRQMVRGTFRPEQVLLATAYCQEDKKTYRINGQHTCWAVLKLPEGFNPNYKVELYRYTCKTTDDVRILYGSFDRNYARSTTTVVNSVLLGKEGYEKYGQRALNLAVAGFSMWKWESYNERQKFDADSRCHIMDTEYHQLTHSILDFFDAHWSAHSAHIWRASVAAAMFETFQKCTSAAIPFWDSVATGVGFESKKDPRLQLRTFLQRTSVSMKRASNKKAVGQEEMYRACIMAWNKHRDGEESSYLQPIQIKKRQRAK